MTIYDELKRVANEGGFCMSFAQRLLVEYPEPKTSSIPDDTVCFFLDGNQIACVRKDFINLQESRPDLGKLSMPHLHV